MELSKKDRNELIKICQEQRQEMLKMSGLIKKQGTIISQLRSLEQEEPVENAGPNFPTYAGVCPACGVITSVVDSRYRCRNCGKRINWDHPLDKMICPVKKNWQE